MKQRESMKLVSEIPSIKTQLDNIKSNVTLKNTSEFRHIALDRGVEEFDFYAYNDGVTPPWDITSSTIKPTITDTSTKGAKAIKRGLNIQDGEIGVTIKGQNSTVAGTMYYGILFRGNNNSEYYLAGINNNDRRVGLYKVSKGGSLVAITAVFITDNSQAVYKDGQPIYLSVKFIGQSVSICINGSTVITSTDVKLNDVNSGQVGLCVGVSIQTTTLVPLVFSDFWYKETKFNHIGTNINKILATGDSIMAGSAISDKTKIWTNLLLNKLKETNPNTVLDNFGVGGNSTDFVLVNQVRPNIVNGYDLLLVQAGTNDCRIDSSGRTLAQSLSNLSAIIKIAKSNGVIPIICTLTPVDRTITGSAYDETSWAKILEFNNAVKVLCSKEKVKVCDNFTAFDNDVTKLNADKIHPNVDGNVILYNEMLKTIFN